MKTIGLLLSLIAIWTITWSACAVRRARRSGIVAYRSELVHRDERPELFRRALGEILGFAFAACTLSLGYWILAGK
jgi:hypothetical protein